MSYRLTGERLGNAGGSVYRLCKIEVVQKSSPEKDAA
jgi:hypothetical protein